MRACIAALAAVVPVVAFAQPIAEEGKSPLDERLFKAFYQESGLRDFEKAAALYAEVADAARAAKDGKTEARALLGRGRCLKVSGKKEEALEAIRAVLALEPGNEEATGLLASLEGGKAPAKDDADLATRCATLMQWLAGQAVNQARREFALLGPRALPYIERALRYRSLEHVEGAARLLATDAIQGGLEALSRGIIDPDVVYSKVLCDAVLEAQTLELNGRDATLADLPLLAAIARRAEPDLRARVVVRVNGADLGADPRAIALVKALAADPDLQVRLQVIRTDWYASYWKEMAPVVVAALKSPHAAERAAAAISVKQDLDLLRTVAGDLRGLLRDPDASVRRAAYATLAETDGLGQADLATLLADADGALVKNAGERLREISPWEKGVGDAVRAALRKAIRAEVPSSGIESVLVFVNADPRPGGLSGEDLVEIFALSWAPEQRLGSLAASAFRANVLNALGNRAAEFEQSNRWILLGLRTIGSADGVLQWLVYWTQENSYRSAEIGIAASASEDSRIRAAGYRCLASSPASSNPGAITAALRHLSKDLMGGDAELQEAAMAVATVYPDPVSVDAIRKHYAAANGGQRASLLWTLVKAVGKDALPEVRADLASKDSSVRSTALHVLFLELGATDYAEIRKYLADGGVPSEVAALWLGGSSRRPSVDLLRTFLGEIGPGKADDGVLRAAALLPVEERNPFLEGILRHPHPAMRSRAATLVASWRAMECVKPLSALLDDPDASVQAAAAKALEDLNKYLERKAAAARLLDGPAVDPLDAAKALLRSPEPEKRRGAVLALGALQDKAAIPLLLKALDDADPTVRAAALAVLERLGGAPR